MFKRLLILSVLVYFALGLGFLYAETPKFKPTPQPPFKPVYDIAITAVWLDENCQLCAKFENKGNVSIKKDVKGEVWVDGKFFSDIILTNFSLPPGQSYIWRGGSKFKLFDSYTVKMIIDSNNQIAESDENNNTMTGSLTCAHYPPLPKPDLIVSEIKFQNVIDKGNCEIFDVIIDVKNIGEAPSGPCKVLLEKKVEPYPDFKIVDEIPVSSLSKGQTVSLPPRTFNTCEGYKQYIFRATADSKNSVAESNEDNNSKTATYPAVEKK